jgi:hypothetical protein
VALFRRRWRVTVGSLRSEDLDIQFEVTRTLRPNPGTCELEVWNLSADHRGEISDASRPLVRLEAGYEDGLSLLFQGDARKITHRREKTDWVTTITAGDGEHAIRHARASRAFGPDTQLRDVVDYIAEQMGVGTGNVSEALQDAALDQLDDVFPRGTVLRGSAADELTQLLRSAGLEWSIQEGVLQVLPRGGALDREAVRLAPATGLVESPQVGKHGVVTAKALLIPDLVPGRLVQLESATVTGTYKIEKARYAGETRGTDWYAELETRQSQ